MKKFARGLSIIIIALLLSAGALAGEAALETRSVFVMDIAGEVYYSTGGRAEFPAKAGVTLRAGFSVRTGGDGEAYLMIDDDKLIKLAPNSDMVISQADTKLVITMRAGELVFNIAKQQPEGSVEFQSGGVSMGIRGTSGYLKRIKDALESAIECGLFDGEVSLQTDKLLLLIKAMEVDSIPTKGVSELKPDNGSLFALLSALDEALDIGLPDDFMNDEDIQLLARLWEEALAEENAPDEGGARRYLSDAEIVMLAQDAIALIEYEPQPYTSTEESLKAYINELLAPIAEQYDVVTQINTIEFASPVNGNADYTSGKSGEYEFNVTVKRNAASDEASPQTIEILPNPYTGTSNAARLTQYKADVEELEIAPLAQANAPDEASIQAYIIDNIAASLNDDAVIITLNCELINPIAGDGDNPEGVNGSYTYTVTLKRGSRTTTTGNKTLLINATPFAGKPNSELIAEYKALIEAHTFAPLAQAQAEDEAAVKAYINGIIADLISDGEVDIVISGELNNPAAGDADYPAGKSGAYAFTVSLKRGIRAATTESITLVINPAPYPGTPNADLLAKYISLIEEELAFAPLAQAQATGEAAVKAYIYGIIADAISDGEVEIVISGALNNPTAGDADYPAGESGAYAFTVTLKRGIHTAVTESITLVINPAPYPGTPNADLLAEYISLIEELAFAPLAQAQATSEAAVKAYINGIIADALNDGKVNVTISGRLIEPIAGDADAPAGTSGVYIFTAALSRGVRTAQSGNLSLTLTATYYPHTSNAEYLNQAINALNAFKYDLYEREAPDTQSARDIVYAQLSGYLGFISELEYEIAQDETELFRAAKTGTESAPDGVDGAYEFTLFLQKGAVTATSNAVKLRIIPVTYAEIQNELILQDYIDYINEFEFDPLYRDDAPDEESIRQYIHYYTIDLFRIELNDELIGGEVVGVSLTWPEQGDADDPDGTPGEYAFTITLERMGVYAYSNQRTLEILDPYQGTTYAEMLEDYTNALLGVTLAPIAQKLATDEAAIKAHISDAITSLLGATYPSYDAPSISVTRAADSGSWIAPIAGTPDEPQEYNGSYTFTSSLTLGTHSATTAQMSIVITATAFTGETNQQLAERLASIISDATFTVSQPNAESIAQARAYVLLAAKNIADNYAELYSLDVDTSSNYNPSSSSAPSYTSAPQGEHFSPASAGDADYTSGTYGYYQCRLIVTVGAKRANTRVLYIQITPTVYEGESNESIIKRAIAAFDDAEDDWTVTRAQAAGESQAEACILGIAKRIATGVDAGISCEIFYNTGTVYSAPVEGDADYPDGEDGYYECTIVVGKGYTGLPTRRTLTICAPYSGESNESILAKQVEYAEGMSISPLSILDLWSNDATPGEAVAATYQTAITNEFGDNITSVAANKVEYISPESYSNSNPDGQDGSFTYYLTLARSIHSMSTSSDPPKSVAIKPYTMAQSLCGDAEWHMDGKSLEPEYNTQELAMGYIFAYLSEIIPSAGEDKYGGTVERELCGVLSFKPAEPGDKNTPDGVTGEINFVVAITAGSMTAYSNTITMYIEPIAYDPEAVLQAFFDALDAADLTVSQAEAPTNSDVTDYTHSFLLEMAQTVNEDIVIHAVQFASLGYIAPIEGDEFYQTGTNGSCEFEVTVKLKDVADLQKQKSYTMTITATPYAGESTESKLARQLELAEGKNIAQLSQADIGAATPGEAVAAIYQTDVNTLIGDELTSVTINNVEYAPAMDFSNSLPDGENGMLTFYLALARGELTRQTNSKSVLLLPYTMADSLCDYAERLLIDEVIPLPEDDTVAKAIEGVLEVLGDKINPDNPYGGTVVLTEDDVISFLPALAPDDENPFGVLGEIVFTLAITAGTKTARTGEITMPINCFASS